jgi:hypothetical protein
MRLSSDGAGSIHNIAHFDLRRKWEGDGSRMGKGEEIPKTKPAEIEKLIEQIRRTDLEPGSRMRQPTEGAPRNCSTNAVAQLLTQKRCALQ